MESRNPAFRGNAFARQTAGWRREQGFQPGYGGQVQDPYGGVPAPPVQRPMTMDDVVVRGALTLTTLVISGALAWVLVPVPAALPVLGLSVLVAFGVWAFITFGQKFNAALVLTYAVFEGVAVGIVSHAYNHLYHGVVFQAVVGTALAFGAMLAVHALKIIRVTPKLARFVIATGFAMMGLMLLNLLVFAFGVEDGIGLRDPGNPLAYVFSVAAIVIGCFFLLLDFDMIEEGVRTGAPEKFAWYCAFALVLALVWIYMELLWLLSALAGRD